MSFVNGVFLAGLAGALLPILIHVFTRDRIQRVAFSTLRFFVKSAGNVLRRKRVEEAVLLAMRVVACALLALAFARPFFRAAGETGGLVEADRARVLVMDVSASMVARGGELRRQGLAAVAELSRGADAAALIAFAGQPRVAQALTRDLGQVEERIKALEITAGATNLVEALRRADAILSTARARVREVVLISDLQRSGWRSFRGAWRLSPGVKLVIRPIAPVAGSGNLAITEAEVPGSMVTDKEPRSLAVRLANYADQERRDVKVALYLGGKEAETHRLHLKAGQRAATRFRQVLDQPGDHPGRITVLAGDARPLDDVFYFNVRVIPRIKVLVINGRPDRDPRKDGAFFLRAALTPVADAPFALRVTTAAATRSADLAGVQVVILSNVRQVASPVRKALADLLQRGGGVLYLPGDRVDAGVFNRQFAAFAPCRLRRAALVQSSRGEPAEARLTRVDYNHPIFEIFLRPHHGDFSTPKFLRFWQVTDSQMARVLARFDAGYPALLEKPIGAGVAMLLVSPVSQGWNNLGLRAIFLPWLHQTVRYLAIRGEPRTAYLVGDRLPAAAGQSIRDPAGTIRPGTDRIARVPGLHRVLDAAGRVVAVYAVNCDPREAAPEHLRPEEVQAAVSAATTEVTAGAGVVVDPQQRDGGLWWYLTLAICVLLAGELFLGNRAIRH